MTNTSLKLVCHRLRPGCSSCARRKHYPTRLGMAQLSLRRNPGRNLKGNAAKLVILFSFTVFFAAATVMAQSTKYIFHDAGPGPIGPWVFKQIGYRAQNLCPYPGWSDWTDYVTGIPNLNPGNTFEYERAGHDWEHVCPAGTMVSNPANLNYWVVVSGQQRVDIYLEGGVPDENDRPRCENPGCTQCGGMPVWSVSEPYINLWIRDEPFGYQPAIGPRISLTLGYKQREIQTGFDPAIFGLGKQWNCSWVSYITNDVNGNHAVNLPGGGSLTFTNGADFLTNTRLSGDTTNGFTLSYPDGSQYFYGSILTNTSGAFQKAFLSEQWNLTGQKTRFEYSLNPTNLVVRLQDVVDGDGRTNYITYVSSNAYSTNLISQVTDGFNRSATFSYDSSGHLISITDVAGLTGSMGYDSNGVVTNLATPYGQTGFKITENASPFGRSIEITEPDASKQLYVYANSASGVASSYPTNQIPNTSPYSNMCETNSLDLRNTFHWDRLQYANLSTNYLLTGDLRLVTLHFDREVLREGHLDGFGEIDVELPRANGFGFGGTQGEGVREERGEDEEG